MDELPCQEAKSYCLGIDRANWELMLILVVVFAERDQSILVWCLGFMSLS